MSKPDNVNMYSVLGQLTSQQLWSVLQTQNATQHSLSILFVQS